MSSSGQRTDNYVLVPLGDIKAWVEVQEVDCIH